MEERKNPFQWLINIWTVTITLLRNTPRVWELARFEFTLQYRDSRLGMVWAILSPLTQIGVYWFTFGIGLRHGSPMGGYPYVVWLVCGMTAWNHLSKGVLSGAGELRSKQGLIAKVSIPPYLLLASRALAALMDHALQIAIMFTIMVANGWRPDHYAPNLCYYIFCSFCFCIAASTIFSAFTLIAADFRRLLESAMRLLFFLSPIFWNPGDNLPAWFQILLVISPFSYIVTGYRNSLLFHQNFWQRPMETAAFWTLTVLLYLFGCQWQSKLHEKMADFI